MENAVDGVGDVAEGGRRNDGIVRNAVLAVGERGDEREAGGSDERGVALELDQLPWAHDDGPELQDGAVLAGRAGHGGLQVEEGDLVALLARRH